MIEFKFGDALRYPKDQDPDDEPNWVFMFLGDRGRWIDTVLIRVHWQDDQWTAGEVIAAAPHELELIQ